MTPTDEEVFAALGHSELTGIEVARSIEIMWEEEGRRERFLIWTFEASMGFSTIYRVLKRLVDEDKVTSRAVPGSPRRLYKLKADSPSRL